MAELPGGDTLLIVTRVPTGQKDALNQDIFTEATVSVYGCVFEPYSRGPVEEDSNTETAHERAWAFLPYIEGVTTGINNQNFIQPVRPGSPLAQRNYKVQGLPEIQYDLDGVPDHVWIICEYHEG